MKTNEKLEQIENLLSEIKLELVDNSKMSFVENEETNLIETEKQQLTERMLNFKKDENKVLISKYHQQKYNDYRTEIYNLLKERRVKTMNQITRLITEIETLRKNSTTISKYITEIKIKVNKIEDLRMNKLNKLTEYISTIDKLKSEELKKAA